ncbi:hypothetical protein HID58_011434 [Brassica napus]|uniref:Uncharacterized protein n=1 Tax=Brassica napus TaxID=3708 RepID=A0ABQ8DY50_BRANA|nr:hypothetical protein HID58_011434 [Brassica napus]
MLSRSDHLAQLLKGLRSRQLSSTSGKRGTVGSRAPLAPPIQQFSNILIAVLIVKDSILARINIRKFKDLFSQWFTFE